MEVTGQAAAGVRDLQAALDATAAGHAAESYRQLLQTLRELADFIRGIDDVMPVILGIVATAAGSGTQDSPAPDATAEAPYSRTRARKPKPGPATPDEAAGTAP